MPSIMPEGSDYIRARPGMDQSLPGDKIEGGVVVHIVPASGLNYRAAMAVVGVFAKAQVGDDGEVACRFFSHAYGLGYDSGVGYRVGAGGVFFFRNAEKDNAAKAQFHGLRDLVGEHVGRHLEIARHGGDFLLETLAGPDEKRQNKIRRRKAGFFNQFAHRRIVSQAAHPSDGKGGNVGHLCFYNSWADANFSPRFLGEGTANLQYANIR
jgi:hypothetical protein